MKDLTIIDFSHNSLREVPPNLEYAKGAIVLSLSNNNIENIPNGVRKTELAQCFFCCIYSSPICQWIF